MFIDSYDLCSLYFCLSFCRDYFILHSFPTRRSSELHASVGKCSQKYMNMYTLRLTAFSKSAVFLPFYNRFLKYSKKFASKMLFSIQKQQDRSFTRKRGDSFCRNKNNGVFWTVV